MRKGDKMTEERKVQENEELVKSIDEMIDALFAEEEKVEKSEEVTEEATAEETTEEVEKSMIKDDKPQEETADEAVKKIPKAEKDEKRNAGRPEQISDIPQIDKDGKRDGNYDADIAKKNEDGKVKEQDQVEPPKEMKKSLSEEEYQEYQELKKSKEEAEKEEVLKKAKQEQSDLIKSAIIEATKEIRDENSELHKKLEEQGELIKSMANKPQKSKAITNINAVEKSFSDKKEDTLSKAELLDIAEDLVKSKKLSMENVIELENTGYIYDKDARKTLEREVKRRK